jgi:HD superfamily phosphodiesterase
MNSQIRSLEKLLKEHYHKYKSPSHGWDHIQRTLDYALRISENEKPDLNILIPAILLHDIDRSEKEHFSSKLPEEFLKRAGFSKREREKIIRCIETHSTFSQKSPKTIEEKILFDADKLDSFGAVGIARFFIFAGENKWGLETALNDAFERIKNLERRGFYTKEAEKIGTEKVRNSLDFFLTAMKELGIK